MPITAAERRKLKRLGARIKKLRIQKNLTLKELAYTIGKDPQSISRVEHGGVNPSYLFLLEVCEGLKIDITELFESSQNQ